MDPFWESGTMGGLLDTFWRHFVVLTNFIEMRPESRPYCPRSPATYQGGLQGRPGPGGVGRGMGGRTWGRSRGRCRQTTHSAPCRGYGARFAVCPPLGLGTWHVAGYPVLPTLDTHPVYPTLVLPGTATPAVDMLVPGTNTVCGTAGTCTYGRFWDGLGEPRGVEYSQL